MFSTLLIAAGLITAAPADTLNQAQITADKGVIVSSSDTVSTNNTISVNDFISRMPGLLLNDYGSLSGLKTVSMRGMGASHTAIYLDGVRVSNLQSGQGDLGMLDMNNIASAVVDYAQNRLSFVTANPQFREGNRVSAKLSLKAGSFGTYLPSAQLAYKLNDDLAFALSASEVRSDGDFSYGDGQKREGNDIKSDRISLDAFGEGWTAKAYLNKTNRGTPGSTAYPSLDRQNDLNAFVQGRLSRQISDAYRFSASAKYAHDNLEYKTSYGDSSYDQNEIQLNTSHILSALDWLDLSFAADFQYDKLESGNYNVANNERLTAFGAIGAALHLGVLSADFALEGTSVSDKEALTRQFLSPSADITLDLAKGLQVVGFVRRAVHIPTFNDLYYAGSGNPDLKVEEGMMYDLGLRYRAGLWENLATRLAVDGFYNDLTNKITWAPADESGWLWLPYNIGHVQSKGADAKFGLDWTIGDWKASLDAKYSYLDAKDVTDKSSKVQLAYTAKHSGMISASASAYGFSLGAVLNVRKGVWGSYDVMPDWNTLDINLSKEFLLRRAGSLAFSIMARNVTDCRYELSSGYPMPGRAVYAGVAYNF